MSAIQGDLFQWLFSQVLLSYHHVISGDWLIPHVFATVVLDSAILGVLPASSELLGGRRVLPPHAHEAGYAPLPVDPLVVNFEEGMRLYWNYMY